MKQIDKANLLACMNALSDQYERCKDIAPRAGLSVRRVANVLGILAMKSLVDRRYVLAPGKSLNPVAAYRRKKTF